MRLQRLSNGSMDSQIKLNRNFPTAEVIRGFWSWIAVERINQRDLEINLGCVSFCLADLLSPENATESQATNLTDTDVQVKEKRTSLCYGRKATVSHPMTPTHIDLLQLVTPLPYCYKCVISYPVKQWYKIMILTLVMKHTIISNDLVPP